MRRDRQSAGLWAAALLLTAAAPAAAQPPPAPKSGRTVTADVVAVQQCIPVNRLGATIRGGMLFALKRDVIGADGGDLVPGRVQLRPDKRARPIVLRVSAGDELKITFTNLINPAPEDNDKAACLRGADKMLVATRCAGLHVAGLALKSAPADDGSWVGQNPNSLAAPGETKTYTYLAEREGVYMIHSPGAAFGNGNNAGQLTAGLFGCVVVEPPGAEYYRSQVSERDLSLATTAGPTSRVINYDAVFPANARYPDGTAIPAGTPILNMLNDKNEIVHSDLTACVTGPKHGRFKDGTFPPDKSYPDRDRPFREVVIHYHDALGVITPAFNLNQPTDPAPTVNSAMDAFAINYGAAAIAPEVWANRIGVGPMHNSPESKFEEFFLSAWVVGDPAMVVDVPANSPLVPPHGPQPPNCAQGPDLLCPPRKGPKATKAFYPDDPSNVYHTYLGERVIFRVVHAGANITHVHHQHAHQWLRTPGSDNSTLMDSQTITPGDCYTLDMIYGAGNRNLTPGDSIFHCHFYPHFAAGMWAMWRVHDTYEPGTKLDANGIPVPGARALPDGEIAAGTPTPGLVPLPTIAMAPDPAPIRIVPAVDPTGKPTGGYKAELQDPTNPNNPGYPFFVPGVGGRRPPHPPYDFATVGGQTLDGGLPRHIVLNGDVAYQQQNRWDFTRETGDLVAAQLEETGTPVELKAMAYHQKWQHPSFTPEGKPAVFFTNGSKPRPGAPIADPTTDHFKGPAKTQPNLVRYRGANIQLDVVFNKKGWHYPQQRIITLWGDVDATLKGTRRPEPLFFRAASTDLVEYTQANLVPDYYEMDNFQVRTPTDVIGQHIHLVKFDVLASDGAANGFNYEDGTFSPDDVRKRIDHINATGGLYPPGWEAAKTPVQTKLTAKPIPFFGPGPDGKQWVGAQATVQLWLADPLLNNEGDDRTLRTVFTHDHFGPSTHQQAGLYAGLIVEPKGAVWKSAEDGSLMGKRVLPGLPDGDGGPTSWQAIIEYPTKDYKKEFFREFALEFQDTALAYQPTSRSQAVPYAEYTLVPGTPVPKSGWYESDPTKVVNPPGNPAFGTALQIVSTGQPGTRSVNYRNEPIPLRLRLPGPDTPGGVDPDATDLAHVYRSVVRNDPAMNAQPVAGSSIGPAGFKFPAPFAGAGPLDPYTPLLRAYENDPIRIRTLVGAHQMDHSFHIHGLTWLTEPSYPDSGYRSTMGMGISEHFEFDVTLPRTGGKSDFADYLYQPSSGTDGQTTGVWGLLRAYKGAEPGVAPLPSNPPGPPPPKGKRGGYPDRAALYADLAAKKQVRPYRVTAITTKQALKYSDEYKGQLVYYPGPTPNGLPPVTDANGLMYVFTDDLIPDPADPTKLKTLPKDAPAVPLVLRANAGELIEVELTNALTAADLADFPVTLPANGARPYSFFTPASGYDPKKYQLGTSPSVGLHPQKVDYDIASGNGFNAGANPVRTVPPGGKLTYRWYAGLVVPQPGGGVKGVPVEFGAVNLLPADPLMQHPHGLFAALVVEPAGAKWKDKDGPEATITTADGKQFDEQVLMLQSTIAGHNNLFAFNYRAETMARRLPNPTADWNTQVLSAATSDDQVGGTGNDPHTPVLAARPGVPFRIRLLQPGGQGGVPNVVLHGHAWQRQPYAKGGTQIGFNPLSEWTGSTGQLVPNDQYEMVIWQPGGPTGVQADYLYRDFLSQDFSFGAWGVFRVSDQTQLSVTQPTFDGPDLVVRGRVARAGGAMVSLGVPGQAPQVVAPDPLTGRFELRLPAAAQPQQATVAAGGTTRVLRAAQPVPLRFGPRPQSAEDRRREALEGLFQFR